jgi:hypothetical protein
MRFTAEDIRQHLQQPGTGPSSPNSPDINMQYLMSNMATAAQNSLLEGCPVFIDRLRKSPELAKQIKDSMFSWGKGEDNSHRD